LEDLVSVQPTRLGLATALAVVALMGAACSAGQPAATTAPTGTAGASATAGAAAPSTGAWGTSAPSGASGLSADQVAQAHQGALGLVALGGLGSEKGTTDAIRTLAGRVTSEGRALDEQIRTLATAQGLTLTDDVGAQIQGVLNDLQARSGQPFDQAWLRAVGDLVEQGRAAANAVLSSPDASDEAKAAARDALARLDALAAAIRDASAASGAGTPNAVNAGTGGQAEDSNAALPAALAGLGALLIAAALRLRRRRA
jgi:predicted outer membrane protein